MKVQKKENGEELSDQQKKNIPQQSVKVMFFLDRCVTRPRKSTYKEEDVKK